METKAESNKQRDHYQEELQNGAKNIQKHVNIDGNWRDVLNDEENLEPSKKNSPGRDMIMYFDDRSAVTDALMIGSTANYEQE